MEGVYLDNNATTMPDPRVVEVMRPFLEHAFHNPSSPYQAAREPALAIDRARRSILTDLEASGFDLVFTSGGTESNALALLGSLPVTGDRNRFLIGATEHASIRELAPALRERGLRVDEIRVTQDGQPDQAHLASLLDQDVAVVSLMAANNETGVMPDLPSVAALTHGVGARLHTDASQLPGRAGFSAEECGADLVTICSHKCHGPKGIGALLVRCGLALTPLMRGGDQERGLRPGTEPVAAIAGFGQAVSLAVQEGVGEMDRIQISRDRLEAAVVSGVAGVRIAGRAARRLPNTTMLVVDGVAAESVIARMDMEGFQVSSGSACTSGAIEPSHVLSAMGLVSPGSAGIRVSLSRWTTEAEAAGAAEALIRIIHGLRKRP